MNRRLTAFLASCALATGTVVALAPAAQADGPTLAASAHRVPVVDSLAGHGEPPMADDGVVAILDPEAGHDSALIRLSVFDAASTVEIVAAGAPALSVQEGGSASTTVLVPLVNGSVPVSASAEVDARVELLASFASADVPGATHALAVPVTRADTGVGLAADALGSEPVPVGVVGAGDVPETGVRAVYLTATFDVAAADTARIADQELPLSAGRTTVTTVAVVTEDGTVPVALGTGTGHVRVDVRGWVSEAAQDAPTANVVGSYLPALGAEPASVQVPVGASVPVGSPALAGQSLALALVWGTADGDRAFLDIGDGLDGRARGALASDGVIAPQLVVIDGDLASSRGADVELTVLPLGGILLEELPGDPRIDMALVEGARIDLSTSGWFTLSGTVQGVRDIDRVEILAGDTVVGTASLTYRSNDVGWRYETAAPRGGEHALTARVVTHGGRQAEVSRTVEIVLPDAEATVLSPETVVVPEEGTDGEPLVTAVSDQEVLFGADPGLTPGAVIVSGVAANAPSGFLRRVVAIDRTEDGWRVLTQDAALTDALVQASVTDEVDALAQGAAIDTDVERRPEGSAVEIVDDGRVPVSLVTGADVEVGPFEEETDADDEGTSTGAATKAAGSSAGTKDAAGTLPRQGLLASRIAATTASDGGFGIDESLTAALSMRAAWATDTSTTWDLTSASDPRYLQSKGQIESSGGLAMSAEAQLSATLSITLRISATFDWGRPRVEVEDFSVLLTTSARGKAELSAHLETMTTKEFEVLFAHVDLPSLTFYIPTPTAAVPVVIENTFRLYLRSTFEAKVSLEAQFAIQRTETYGFRYSSAGGVEDVHEGPDVSTRTPTLSRHASAVAEGTLDAVATFEPELSMKIYGLLGPVFTGGFGPRITAELVAAAGDHTPVLEARVRLYLRLSLEGRLEFTVPIIDRKLLDHEMLALSQDIPVADLTWVGDEIFDQVGDDRPTPSPLPADWAYTRSIGISFDWYGTRGYVVDIERDRLIRLPTGQPAEFEGRVLGVFEGTTLRRLDLAPALVADAALSAADGTVLILDEAAQDDARDIALRRYDPATGSFGENRLVVEARSCETLVPWSVDADPTRGVLLVMGSFLRLAEEDGECQRGVVADAGMKAWTLDGESLARIGEFALPEAFGEAQHVLFAPDGEDAYLLNSNGTTTQLVTVPLTPGILRGPETLADIPQVHDATIDPRDGSLVLAAGSLREDERSFETNLWRLDLAWGDVLESPAIATEPVPDNLVGVRYHHHFTGVTFDGEGHLYAIEANYRVPWDPAPAQLWMSETGELSDLTQAVTNLGTDIGSASSWTGNQRLVAAPDGAVLWSDAAALIKAGGFERHRDPVTVTFEENPVGEAVARYEASGSGCENDLWEQRLCLVTASGVLAVVEQGPGGFVLTTSDGGEPISTGAEGTYGTPQWIEEFDGKLVVAYDGDLTASLAFVDLATRDMTVVPLGEYGLTRARSVDDELRVVLGPPGGQGSAVLVTVRLDGTDVRSVPLSDPTGSDPTDLASVTSQWPIALTIDEARGAAYLLDSDGRLHRVDLADGHVPWVSAPAWTAAGLDSGTRGDLAVTASGDVVGVHGNTVFSYRHDGTANWSHDILLPGQEYLATSEELTERTNVIREVTVVGDDVLIMARQSFGGRAGHDGYVWRFDRSGDLVDGGRLPIDLSGAPWSGYYWFRLLEDGVIAWSGGGGYGLVRVS